MTLKMILFKLNTMRNLKPIYVLILIVIFATGTANAQPPGKDHPNKKERIEQLKIAFITKELELTTDEAEKFWPVYNEMADKIHKKKKEERKLQKELKENFDTLSEADIKSKSQSILSSEVGQAELKKEYHDKIAEVIGYKKATKLLSLEQRFKRELLEQMKGRREPPHERPAPNRPN
jgi:hypothetical protein